MAVSAAPTRGLLVTVALCFLSLVPFARAQQASPTEHSATYRIAGTAVSKLDGNPLDRARVTLRDVKTGQEVQAIITTADGKFTFEGLAVGKYSLAGAKRGFITAGFDQHDQFATAIVSGAGLDTEHLVLKLSPAAIIAGTVLDERGDPVRHATVTIFRKDHSEGIDQIHSFRSAQTDDLGAYEIASLLPGTYFLAASAEPWYAVHPASDAERVNSKNADDSTNFDRTLDVAYPLTYYTDATEPESATPIQLQGGERLRMDFHLNPVPALRFLVHVAGEGTSGWIVPALQRPGFDGFTYVQASPRMLSPGVFEISGVPAGHYQLQIRGHDGGVHMSELDVGKDGEQFDASTAQALSTIKFSVQMPGGAALPPGLAIALHTRSSMLNRWQRVDSKGEGEIKEVPAGTYDVLPFGSGKFYWISSISGEGIQVSGHTVTIAAGTTVSVSLKVSSGAVQVQGTAKRAGKGLAGAMVVLVPQNPESDRDLFRRDQSDLDGTFTLRNVVPGSYTLLAIEDGWELDWSRPDVIQPYLKRGRAVQVNGSSAKPLILSDAIEVQSK